jgi:hypothetical protein
MEYYNEENRDHPLNIGLRGQERRVGLSTKTPKTPRNSGALG